MTDQELVKGLAEKNAAAFDEIYKKLHRKFCAFAKNILNDPHEAYEQTAEAFVKLWATDKEFASLEHVNNFLYLVIKNSCVSYLREKVQKSKYEKQMKDAGELSENAIERKFQEADLFARLYSRIEELPEMRQKVFKLTYFDGLSRAEIAEQLGISQSTVKNQNYEAMKWLRIYMGIEKMVTAVTLALFFSRLL